MPDTVPPERVDALFGLSDDDVGDPRPYTDLVADLMEVRRCSRPAAKRWLDEHGDRAAEAAIQSRWLL